MKGKLHGLDLFSGIGGIGIALSPWVRTVAYCEREPYCQAVLLSRMSTNNIDRAPIWDDVRTLHKGLLPPIDIIFGGFPCQDISVAGAGKGLDGERSGLFYEIVRLTKEIRPSFVFLENVPAIRTRGLEKVIKTFTEIGYDCRWTCLSASSVGAPHKRKRWFLLAHANGIKLRTQSEQQQGIKDSPQLGGSLEKRLVADNNSQSKILRQASEWGHNSFYEWIMERDLWDDAASSFCRMDDGISFKTYRIKALGNAVVPLQAQTAFKILAGLR